MGTSGLSMKPLHVAADFIIARFDTSLIFAVWWQTLFGLASTSATPKPLIFKSSSWQTLLFTHIKVLVKKRWCFIEFHTVEPSLEALRKSYGTSDIRVHWIRRHADAAPLGCSMDARA